VSACPIPPPTPIRPANKLTATGETLTNTALIAPTTPKDNPRNSAGMATVIAVVQTMPFIELIVQSVPSNMMNHETVGISA
jgi:hypothetical protein